MADRIDLGLAVGCRLLVLGFAVLWFVGDVLGSGRRCGGLRVRGEVNGGAGRAVVLPWLDVEVSGWRRSPVLGSAG